MKQIPLTQGKFALVDDEDFEWLSQWKWQASKKFNTFYASRAEYMGWDDVKQYYVQKKILMHNVVLCKDSKLVEHDHKDNNGLNNQKDNLRPCSHSMNMKNQKVQNRKNKSSQYKGVSKHKKELVYRAMIRKNGELIKLGKYDTEADAANAYNEAAIKYFGEFAHLNIIKGDKK